MLSLEQKEALQVLADVYLNQAQSEKAVVLLEALHNLDRRDPVVAKALSYGYLLIGRPEDALAMSDVFLRLVGASPESNPILLIRGRALWALGRAEEARMTMNRYVELGGDA